MATSSFHAIEAKGLLLPPPQGGRSDGVDSSQGQMGAEPASDTAGLAPSLLVVLDEG